MAEIDHAQEIGVAPVMLRIQASGHLTGELYIWIRSGIDHVLLSREEADAFRTALAVVDGPESEAIKRWEQRQRKESNATSE